MTQAGDASLLAERLKNAGRVLFLTGAGISADSGLPVYRGQGGLYNSGATEEGIPFEEVLSAQTLRTAPGRIWEFLGRIDSANRNAAPSAAHRILAGFQKSLTGDVLLVTQNIDGLHTKAGSSDVVELHGSLHRIRCEHCGWKAAIENYDRLDALRVCPECHYVTRPDVVLFGESLPYREIQRLVDESALGFDIGFAIGTTASFPYIRSPFEQIKEGGGLVVEINPCETALSDLADYKLRTTASKALELIAQNICV